MKTEPIQIFLFTALSCEAKPLIEHFKLKKDLSTQSFEHYRRGNLSLTITGVGKVAMAAGTAYTMARHQTKGYPVLLNIGIAGHGIHDVGRIFLIDKISDRESGKNFYPPIVFSPPCPTVEVHTVARPESEYSESGLYDMEASAFYETAMRFTTAELAHSIKVVSDNSTSPAETVKPNHVNRWLADSLPVIEAILGKLTAMSRMLDLPELGLLEEICRRVHVTASQKKQLERRLNRWHCLKGVEPNIDWLVIDTAKALINWLDQQTDLGEFEL